MESTRMHGGEECGAYLRAAKHPALIVFDLDGTIADSRDMARESYKRVFAMMGYGMITDALADSFNGPDADEVCRAMGIGPDRPELYDKLVDQNDGMVFCNTKGNTERITKFLQMRGIDAQCIHGDIPQKKREQVMNLFRKGKLRVFVSTDVAARGIDVDDVDIVFNCDIPDENQDYVHRIGRTGRAKRQGVAVSFVADFPSKIRMDDIAKNTRNEILPVKFDDDGKLTMA